MKRFIVSILTVSIFFIGLGALVDKVGAKFKSDEKALELIRLARLAIGGDSSIAAVRSMSIKGTTTETFKFDGTSRTMQGETEIALQLPDKMMRMVKIGHEDGSETSEKIVNNQLDVVVVGDGEEGQVRLGSGTGVGIGHGVESVATAESNGKPVQKIVIRKGDGTTEELKGEPGQKVMVRKVEGGNVEWKTEGGDDKTADGQRVMIRRNAEAHHGEMRQNELLRTTLSLLLSAPEGLEVNYLYKGERDVDGTPCNVIEAQAAGSSINLYLDKASNLPVMVSYIGHELPRIMHFTKELPPPSGDNSKDTVFFTNKVDSPETAEFHVKFSDYRGVDGVQLPFRWTQTVNGEASETFDVTSYEINPTNIAEKFQNQKVFVRTKKDSQ